MSRVIILHFLHFEKINAWFLMGGVRKDVRLE